MPFGKGRRKALLLGIVLILLVCLALISLPIWFPWIVRPLAAHAGLRFGSYQRLGYSRFVLKDVAVNSESLELHAQRVQALVPTVWLLKLAMLPGTGLQPFVLIDGWNCRLLPGNTPPSPPNAQVQDAAAAFRMVNRWLPAAELSKGSLQSGDLTFGLEQASWRRGNLHAQILLPAALSGRAANVDLVPARPFQLHVAFSALNVESTVQVSTNGAGFDAVGVGLWQSNRFDLQAHFGPIDFLPKEARLSATNFLIPAGLLKLPYYQSVSGSVAVDWREGGFNLKISVAAQPLPAETNWPPAELLLSARGNTNSAIVEKLALNSIFLRASLSDPLAVAFAEPYIRGPAKLSLEGDLSQQRWFPIQGRITGQAEVAPGAGKLPSVRLHLIGSNVGDATLKASSIQLEANLDGSMLHLVSAQAQFDDTSRVSAAAAYDLEHNFLTNGLVKADGPLARHWLPPSYSLETASVTANFDGPVTNLTHSGRLQVSQLRLPRFQPLELAADWKGSAMTLEHFAVRLATTNLSFSTEGALSIGINRSAANLLTLAIATNDVPVLALAQPCAVAFSHATTNHGWELNLAPLHASGSAGELTAQASVDWPEHGVFACSLERFPVQVLAPFIRTSLPQIDVMRVAASGGWSNSPLTLQVSAKAMGRFAPQPATGANPGRQLGTTRETATAKLLSTPIDVDLGLYGDGHGLVLSNLLVNSPTSAIATAHGFLPLAFKPADPTNLLDIDAKQPLRFDLSVRPEAFFWQAISQLTGVRFEDPTVDLNVAGTWGSPEGAILARVHGIRLEHTTLTNLTLSDLRLALKVDRARAQLTEGQVLVQGQRVSLSGELPLGDGAWTQLRRKSLPDWEKASAQLRIDNAQLAAFQRLFPEVIAPQGEVDVNLQLRPGANFDGSVILRHARTRPLGNTEPLRDINVTLRFSDRILSLENASANLSGAAVELTGRADLRGTNWLAEGWPPFALTLRGTNVPLARAPEYIIRSDLDLAILKTNNAAPVVLGTARLRDSFYLSDLGDLVPGKVAAPSSRPPFFSIDNPTVADWRLAVTVEGVRWLKLRTSLFNGEVSANLHLEGTLREPIALGGLKVDSGIVRFPFANLQVQQGLVTLTSQDPYRPQLLVRATSKQFGYDIRMEVTGSVDSPIIQFTSNPSLSSEQILLMITAGQLPQGTLTLTPQQRAQTVALFLGRDLLSKLGLGDQSQDRLTISSGEEISVQNRPTYRVEYKLTPRWSLTGEYDRFGDFNAGFKWRIYSK